MQQPLVAQWYIATQTPQRYLRPVGVPFAVAEVEVLPPTSPIARGSRGYRRSPNRSTSEPHTGVFAHRWPPILPQWWGCWPIEGLRVSPGHVFAEPHINRQRFVAEDVTAQSWLSSMPPDTCTRPSSCQDHDGPFQEAAPGFLGVIASSNRLRAA